MSKGRGQTCMATFAFSFLLAIALLGFASMALGRGHDQRTSTVERVLQPEASIQLEAQQLAAQDAQQQRDAERIERRDNMIFYGGLFALVVGALLAFALIVARRPRIVDQHITMQLPEGVTAEMIDAQWRVIDAQRVGSGYEMQRVKRR